MPETCSEASEPDAKYEVTRLSEAECPEPR